MSCSTFPKKTKIQLTKGLGLKLMITEELETNETWLYKYVPFNRHYKSCDQVVLAMNKRSAIHVGCCAFNSRKRSDGT